MMICISMRKGSSINEFSYSNELGIHVLQYSNQDDKSELLTQVTSILVSRKLKEFYIKTINSWYSFIP